MPKIFPFKALRPTSDYVGMVTAKSTDFPNQEDLVHEIRLNSFTFHHVTKSHLSYSGAFQEPEKFLPFASQYIQSMKTKGVFMKEDEPAFYVYEQIRKDGKSFKGIIALCSIDDYKNNNIKKHEEIRPSRLKFLVELFKTTKVMGEPTLLAYNGIVPLEEVAKEDVFSFLTVDEKKHIVQKITQPEDIAKIEKAMTAIDSFYIADGHHRSASTEEFNRKVNRLQNDRTMCFIVQEDQLEISPFHRLIKPVSPIADDTLIARLSAHFMVSKSAKSLYEVQEKNTFGIYTNKQWYNLKLKAETAMMDVDIVEQYIVREIYGIVDSKTDSQISFHPHTSGEQMMCGLVNDGTYAVAITNKACSFEEVRNVSDAGKTLPPKSTYIEPKLRAGLIIQEFETIKK